MLDHAVLVDKPGPLQRLQIRCVLNRLDPADQFADRLHRVAQPPGQGLDQIGDPDQDRPEFDKGRGQVIADRLGQPCELAVQLGAPRDQVVRQDPGRVPRLLAHPIQLVATVAQHGHEPRALAIERPERNPERLLVRLGIGDRIGQVAQHLLA